MAVVVILVVTLLTAWVKQSAMLEVEVMKAVMIGLVATDIAGLHQEEVIVIICINCYCIFVREFTCCRHVFLKIQAAG